MEEFGVLSLLLTISAFLIYLFTLGSFQFLFRSVHGDEREIRTAFWSSLSITVSISLICVAAGVFWIDQITALLNLSSFKTEFQLTIIATATTSVMVIFLYYHYGLKRNNFQNFLQFLRGSLWVIVSIVVSVYNNLTLVEILVTTNLCMCFILLLSVPWRDFPQLFPIIVSKEAYQKLFKYCLPLLPYFVCTWGIPMIIRSQLNIVDGAKEVAIFSVAYTLMDIIFMFVSTITATLSPYFFSESVNDNKPGLFYNIMLKYSILCIVLIVPFIYMLRYDIILLVASEKYKQGGDYIPVLILFPLLRILIGIFEQYYLKSSETSFLGIVYSLGILFSFLSSGFLIPKYSVYGAITASLISYAFIFICLSIRRRGVVDFAYLRLPALIKLTVILWATVLMLGFLDFSNFYKIIPLGISALLSLFLLPVLDKEEKRKFLSMLK